MQAGAAGLLGTAAMKRVHAQNGEGNSKKNKRGDLSYLDSVPFRFTPFTVDLPIAPVIQPVGIGTPPYTPGDVFHGIAPEFAQLARWELRPTKYYELRTQEATHQFIPGVETPVWGYNGIVPGPTFKGRIGEPTVVRVHNDLPVENSVHLHGGHTPTHADGFPNFYVLPGRARDYFYPNTVPLENGEPDFNESVSTEWYHDHAMDITGHNVYMGLAGFFLVTDDLEEGLIARNILPREPYDIPIVLNDKVFNPDGTLFYDFLDHNGQLGNVYLANGKAQPRLVVERRKYRFRILDGSNARFFNLRLSNGQSFLQIANDSWLLPQAIAKRSVMLSMAKRAEIIVDFTNAPSELYLENTARQEDGRGPNGRLDQPTKLIKFVVRGPRVPNDATITDGTPLRPHTVIRPDEIVATRRFEFIRRNGAWQINRLFFDPDRADAIPRLGTAERWILKNEGGGWWHPIHIHLESHQIVRLNGRVPQLSDRFKSDTTILGPNDEAEVFMKFRTFNGPFVFHCHNVEHEDMRMMFVFDPRENPVPAPAPVVFKFP